jgi:hypothetical protein
MVGERGALPILLALVASSGACAAAIPCWLSMVLPAVAFMCWPKSCTSSVTIVPCSYAAFAFAVAFERQTTTEATSG